MTGQRGDGDRARMERGGVAALAAADGLALLDLALARDEAVLVPARLDVAGLRVRGRGRARATARPGLAVRRPGAPACERGF